MNKKIYWKATIDGLFGSLILQFLNTFCISVFSTGYSFEQFFLVTIFGALLSTSIYCIFLLKEYENKKVRYFTALGFLFFIIGRVIFLFLDLTVKWEILPLRETNSADGLLIIFMAVCFILTSILLRACVFILLMIRNKRRNQSEDSSVIDEE